MPQLVRFFHIRPAAATQRFNTKGGATVRVTGNPATSDVVQVQVSYCSFNDAFCRKTGREVAAKHPILPIKRDWLPNILQDVARDVVKNSKCPKSMRAYNDLWNTDYSFAIRYFEPKEEPAVAC